MARTWFLAAGQGASHAPPGGPRAHYGLAVAADLVEEQGPHLEQDGHEPYAGHEYASPGPGRPRVRLGR